MSSPAHNKSGLLDDEEDFFDFITRFQSKRMDDQRCTLSVPSGANARNQKVPQAASAHSLPMPPSTKGANRTLGGTTCAILILFSKLLLNCKEVLLWERVDMFTTLLSVSLSFPTHMNKLLQSMCICRSFNNGPLSVNMLGACPCNQART